MPQVPQVPALKPAWFDLTVPNAPEIRDFYAQVIGWTAEEVDMDGYADYNMTDTGGTPVAGICHQKGPNAKLPPAWIAYVGVPSLAKALEQVRAQGGEVIDARTQIAIIRDPAGAYLGLWQEGTG